jgi:RluA family pseudouridine synthase
VYVNGIRVLKNIRLALPSKIEYFEPKFDLHKAAEFFPRFQVQDIVYEDQDLIVVYKPAGLPAVPAREQTYFNLKRFVEEYLQTPIHIPSRLDTAAQGLMLASKTKRAHQPIQRLFEQRRIYKSYALLSSHRASWRTLEVAWPIGRDERHPVLRKIDLTHGKAAHTIFRLGSVTTEHNTLLHAQPITGRTHQIRVHAASIGHPIIGDAFYNGQPADSLHLVCQELGFSHPFSSRGMLVTLPEHLAPKWLS